jgi:SAM-dependent methyltransferase
VSAASQKTVAAYDSHGLYWAGRTRAQVVERGSALERFLLDAVGGLGLDARIFEIGSGTGRDAAWLESRGYWVHRSDASATLRDELEQRDGKPVLPFDVTMDPLPECDLLIANAVLHHLDGPECFRVLKDARKACRRLAVGVRAGDGTAEDEWKASLGLPARYYMLWKPEDLFAALLAAGFTRVAMEVGPEPFSGGGAGADWIYAVAS